MKISKAFGFLALLLPVIGFALPNQELNVDSVDTGSEVSTVNDNFRRLNAGKLDNNPRGVNPHTDSKYDLGEVGREWRYLYVDSIAVSTITASSATLTNISATSISATSVSATTVTATSVVATTITLNENTLSFATQTQQEAGTSTTTIVSPGRQQYHALSPKAWINFDSSSVSGIHIRASANVSSVTDNSTGNYTLNWTVAFSTTSYCTILSTKASSGVAGLAQFVSRTVSAYRFITTNTSGNPIDNSENDVVAFGDQ